MIVTECVHAYSSAYTLTACDSVFHTLGMDTEVVDSGGYHDNAVNNSRLTFPAGGTFLVFGSAEWNNPGFDIRTRLAKNGVGLAYDYGTDAFAAAPTNLSGPLTFWLDNFAAGDYMETQTWCDAGGNANALLQMVAVGVDGFSCHVADSAASGAASRILTFGTVIYDAHGMQTASDRITCQKAGYYLFLTNVHGANAGTRLELNGSGVALNGSLTVSARGAVDYVVTYMNIGDYMQVRLWNGPGVDVRQFVGVYLGDQSSCLSYAYKSIDLVNNAPGFTGVISTDTEWVDPCGGTPQTTGGTFAPVTGYHLGLAKIHTDGGTFLQNDGVYTSLNGVTLGNLYSTNRHDRGQNETTVAVSAFQSASGDTFTAGWVASSTYVETTFTPMTNVFVTDAGSAGGAQIYRRL